MKNLVEKGKVVFITNAQDKLHCEPFEIEVNIEGALIGNLPLSIRNQNQGLCFTSDSTLLYELNAGIYNYTAKINNDQFKIWRGNIEIIKDSCLEIFLDFKDLNHEVSFIQEKLLGEWLQIDSNCDSCHILKFTRCNEYLITDNFSGMTWPNEYLTYSQDSLILFETLDGMKVTSGYKYEFLTSDTLLIYNFFQSLIPEEPDIDIKLYKINNL